MTPRTRAIVPVHYTGRICDVDAITETAAKAGALVIEDAAQVMGASLPDGRRPGAFGDAGAFSLNPMKVLAAFGDAGAITTNNADVAEKLRAFRYLGTVNGEVCISPELNHKIDALQAALLCDSFARLDEFVDARLRIAKRYDSAFGDLVGCPSIPNDRSAIFFDYTVLAERRDELQAHLTSFGIDEDPDPILMPDQPAYEHLPRPDVPVARFAVKRILSLPCHEKMTDTDVDLVIEGVCSFFASHGH